MKSSSRFALIAFVLAMLVIASGLSFPVVQEPAKQLPTKPEQEKLGPADSEFAPVEDMHHFMEYVCEPGYKGLKQILSTEPENRNTWKAFKSHALVLAETSALVAARAPDDEAKAKQWRQISLKVYQSAASLYKSAGNYDDAKKHYGLMVDQCNQCHTVFADGKHQLAK